MANTGRKIYQFLKEVDADTMIPTGIVKANVIGDPDYAAPVQDYSKCPITAWEAIDPSCTTEPKCAEGYLLNTTSNMCEQVQQSPAAPPTGNGGTPGIAAKVSNEQWGTGGTRIYAPGYPTSGDGPVAATMTTPHFWLNGTALWNGNGDRNPSDGRMNAAAIWSVSSTPTNEYIGFSRKVTVPLAKTVFIGIAGDNCIRIIVNGVTLVDTQDISGGPNFHWWNIYPVQLNAGDNFIELYGMNLGSVAGFGAEIYDMTQAQLVAATNAGQLNIIFSTANIVGQPFDLGETQGWHCAPGWSLDTSGPGDPVCKMIVIQSPTMANTGIKVFANRRRLTNGVPDGYSESNVNGSGLGPYFPPVQDLINCPTP